MSFSGLSWGMQLLSIISVQHGKFWTGRWCSCQACADLQGYFLRNTPNPYLTAFAVVSAPNLCGQLLGPILSATGLYFAGKEKSTQVGPTQVSDAEAGTTESRSTTDRAK